MTLKLEDSKMDTSQLYNQFSNELRQANNCQMQISQKEFELQLIDINLKYGNSDSERNIQNLFKKNNIKVSLHSIENERNTYLTHAIIYALQLAEYEIGNSKNIIFPMAYLALNSINSFISSYNINLDLSLFIRSKISYVSNKLILESNLSLINLRTEIDKLKSLCNIF
jgi:hypothetical protein